MKSISILAAIVLLMPNMAIAQVDRTTGDKVSDLGSITASSDREASRLCRQRGGNLVVKKTVPIKNSTKTSTYYECWYAQQLNKK